MRPLSVFLLFIFLSTIILSQPRENSYDILTTLLTADGITSTEEVNSFKSIYDEILSESKSETEDEDDIYDKHKNLFNLLQDEYLKKYKYESYINKLFKEKEFNCITAVILYKMLCSDLGLAANLYETPYHVYIIAPGSDAKGILIELTDPIDGFDAEQDNSDYIKYLIDYKLITQQELDEKGEEQIYKEFNSETRLINTNNLIAAYYANLASYHLSDNNTLASYNLIKQALSIAPDSSKIEDYNLYWQIHAENIKTDTDSLSSFLLETIDSIPSSDEFRESMITESAIAIELNVSEGKFEAADSIFVKLVSVLPEEKISDTKMRRIKVFKELSKIRSKTIRGEYEEAFNLIVELYNYDSANSGVVEMYLWVGNMYMQNLGLSGNNERLIEVADTLFTDFPETQSVKDHYISACIQNVIYGGLYKTDTKKSKEILLKANNRIPGNPSIIRAIAYLYHHMAMAEIRNHRYEEALDLLYEGLQYDPENEEIKHEIDLTKGLLNKR